MNEMGRNEWDHKEWMRWQGMNEITRNEWDHKEWMRSQGMNGMAGNEWDDKYYIYFMLLNEKLMNWDINEVWMQGYKIPEPIIQKKT